MTREDCAAASWALAEWLKSQEISPADSCKIMAGLSGIIISLIATDEEDAKIGTTAYCRLVEAAVEQCLRKMKEGKVRRIER